MLTRSQYKKIRDNEVSDSSSDSSFLPQHKRQRVERPLPLPELTDRPVRRYDVAVPVYFQKRTTLNRHYRPDERKPYLHQIYIVHEKLGEGSFGIVHRVSKRRGRRKLALKVFKCTEPEYTIDDAKNEVAAWEKVQSHPNIAQFVCAWEQTQTLYMITELCAGSLYDYRATGCHIREAEQWDVLLDMLSALKHLETKFLLHNDIKPDNILVDFKGVYKLADFGLVLDWTKVRVKANQCSQDVYELGLTMLLLTSEINIRVSQRLPQEINDPDFVAHNLRDLADTIAPVIMKMINKASNKMPLASQLLKYKAVREKMAIQRSGPRVNHYAIWKRNRDLFRE